MMRSPNLRRAIVSSALLAMAAAAWSARERVESDRGGTAAPDTYLTFAGPRLVAGPPF